LRSVAVLCCAFGPLIAGQANSAPLLDQSSIEYVDGLAPQHPEAVYEEIGQLGGRAVFEFHNDGPRPQVIPWDERQAQTVTAGISGRLTRIDLGLSQIHSWEPGIKVLNLSIYDGDFTGAGDKVYPDGSPGGFGQLIGNKHIVINDFPVDQFSPMVSIDVRSMGFYVQPGQTFTMVLNYLSPTGGVSWSEGAYDFWINLVPCDYGICVDYEEQDYYNSYIGGYSSVKIAAVDANWYNPSSWLGPVDFNFQTWVDPDLRPGWSVPEPASWMLLIAGFGLMGTALRLRKRGTPASANLP
jgi:hypothetical protein